MQHSVLYMLSADIVEATAKAEGHPAAPLHMIAPWLEVLLWLNNARWRKLGTAAPVEQDGRLLDRLPCFGQLLHLHLAVTNMVSSLLCSFEACSPRAQRKT